MTRPHRIWLSVLAAITSPLWLVVVCFGLVLVVCGAAVMAVIAEVLEP